MKYKIVHYQKTFFQEHFVNKDVTEDAKALLTLVRDLAKFRDNSATILFVSDIYKGANLKKIRIAGTIIKIIIFRHIATVSFQTFFNVAL